MPKKVCSLDYTVFYVQAVTKITTAVGSFDVTVAKNTTGQQLLEDIAKAIGLEETWYFGLLYKLVCFSKSVSLFRSEDDISWIDLSKSVISQVLAVEPIELELSVKCYPKSVDDLLQDITVKLFYNHAKGWLQI